MPIRALPNGRPHTRPQLVAIDRYGWSPSIGIGGRLQSVQVVAITRCAQPQLIKLPELVGVRGR